MAAESEGAVDETLRVALRIIEERVTLSDKMAQDAHRSGFAAAAAANRRRANEGREYAETLRRAIIGSAPEATAGKLEDASLAVAKHPDPTDPESS